ncbi:uncharacterized protein BYT42DRAFT_551606 [Radiomyces spectabilis]|uniref:uncharacterized protein n=1 Tax=Radiomyces spectabilis TaxID=64574 RepID=UPI00221E44B1|nr:uncharacterized protein BYT42DRAFT_551606 [Radiomyces spectabilis]KAI8393597.1 hypothetical protein BYT42DRAFT_551606 [Radiomyces spectabilis]
MASIGIIKSYPQNPRAAKAVIAAAYNGVEVNIQDFDMTQLKDEAFISKFPMGKVPVFESPEVDLFESSAIGYYAAAIKENSPLVGANAVEKALIMQWVLFADNEINNNVGQWIYPLMGYMPYMKPTVDGAIEKTKRAMAALDKILLTKTFLVGESVTYADIALVTSLVLPYKVVFDKAFRSQYKNVTRYFNTLVNQKHFKAALGEITLCETPLKYTPPKKEKKEPKKEAPKKEAAKKEAAPAEEAPKPAPKPKSALDLLPPSKFVMDEWKRMYSNNDSDVAMKWFWEHHDPEGYSLWRVDYKYNDELTMTFMSNNLIGGFYARLERAKKYAFASMVVCGTNNNNTISGYFLIRGQEVPFEVYDAADYDSYSFKKIEPSEYESKKDEIYKYFAWEVEGFADGKIFK